MPTGTLNVMKSEVRELRRLYWWSFTMRFGAGLIGWVLMQTTNLSLVVDARYYDKVAGGVASDWLSGRPSQWLALHGDEPFQPVFMIVLLASFYMLTFGVRAMPLAMAFYCAVTAFAPGVSYRISRQLGAPARAAWFTAWLVALCPAFVFWSGALYKEGLVLLILNIAVFHTLRLQWAWRNRSLLILGLCILALCGLRIYLAMIMAVVFCLALGLGRSRHWSAEAGMHVLLRQCLMVLLFSLAIAGIAVVVDVQDILPPTLSDGLARIEISRRDSAAAPSGYLRDVRVESPAEALRLLPMGLAYFLTTPWPWHTGSIRLILAIPDTTLWTIFLYPLALAGLVRLWRRNFAGTVPLLVAVLAMCCFYAIFVSNIGTAYRMRTQVWLLLAVFAGIGWDAWRSRSDQFRRRSPRARRAPYPRDLQVGTATRLTGPTMPSAKNSIATITTLENLG